jgi:8-oxo-dGTP pyrophosphatase MutT (NUDIX family)/predicted ATPase
MTHRDIENHNAVVLVIRDNEDRFLCLYHNKFDFWTVPLGKAEEGQSAEQAAAAEALEEVGIEVVELAKCYQGTKLYCRDGKHIVTFFHVFEIVQFKGVPVNKEPEKHSRMKYMSASELRDLRRTSDGTIMLLSFLDKLEAQLRAPSSKRGLPPCVKIGLSGSSGAGKTTFSRRLRDEYGAVLHPESVRDWLARKGDLRYASLSDDLFAELQLHLLREYETSSANVFDRSPLDCLYYVSKVSHVLDIKEFRQRAIALLEKYAVIVFFPPYSLYLLDDGIRVADLKHQTEVSSRMLIEAYETGLQDKILIYDHCRTVDENVCELLAFLATHRATEFD